MCPQLKLIQKEKVLFLVKVGNRHLLELSFKTQKIQIALQGRKLNRLDMIIICYLIYKG